MWTSAPKALMRVTFRPPSATTLMAATNANALPVLFLKAMMTNLAEVKTFYNNVNSQFKKFHFIENSK